MKKLAMILLSCAMVFGMTGCGSTEKTEEDLQEEAYEKVEDTYDYKGEDGQTISNVYQKYTFPMNDTSDQLCYCISDSTELDGDYTGVRTYNKFVLVTENSEEKLYYISYNDETGKYNDEYYVYYYMGENKALQNDLKDGIYYNVDDNTNWSATHIYWSADDEKDVATYDTGVDETYMVDELKSEMDSYLESKGLTVDDIRYALQYVKANGL